jgi:fucose permease
MTHPALKRPVVRILVAFLSFVGIGLVSGHLGVSWAYMRVEFGQPLEAVGILLTASMVGYLTSSFLSGVIASRLGNGRMFLLAVGLMLIGILGYATAQSWGVMILVALITGIGNGFIDGGLNAYVAAYHGARTMNWLHACFGIGVTIAPLVMTATAEGPGWRWGYLGIATFFVVLVGVLVLMLVSWEPPVSASSSVSAPQRRAAIMATLRSPLVWLSILMFMIYASAEVIPGQWGFDIFTQVRGVDQPTAGTLVSIYWGTFTVGRIFFGFITPRFKTTVLQRVCILAMVFGAAWLWINPANTGLIGFVFLAFMQAPLFPLFVLDTPHVLGAQRASFAIGFQVAGAGFGAAIGPSIAGVIGQTSLESILPFLLLMTVILFVLNEFLQRASVSHIAATAERVRLGGD